MNCYYCQGIDTMEVQNTSFCAYDIPDPFVVENVPASVCRLCGEKSFPEEFVSALEKINTGDAQVTGFRAFRVFDFRNLEGVQAPESSRKIYSTDNPWIQKMGISRLVEPLMHGYSNVSASHQSHSFDIPFLSLGGPSQPPRILAESNNWLYADSHKELTRYSAWEDANPMLAYGIDMLSHGKAEE